MNENIHDVLSRVLKKVIGLGIAVSIVCAVTGYSHWITGLWFGSIVSYANFILMSKELAKAARVAVSSQPKVSSRKIMFGYFLRYAIIALSLVLVAISDVVELIPFMCGLFMVHIAIYIEYFRSSR